MEQRPTYRAGFALDITLGLGDKIAFMTVRIFTFLIFLILIAGCSSDAYDPALGPRNPRPGAERFLSGRSDIPESQKQCLLNFKPCSQDMLEKLADAPSREIRSLVAANPSANASILEKLMTDKEPGVRQYVASNPKTPRSILIKLNADPDENVRWQVGHRQDSQP